MNLVEFAAGALRFLEQPPERLPADGFVWIYLERAEFDDRQAEVQALARRLGGAPLLDVHAKDLANAAHPSHFDATSVYDRVIFRRLASAAEVAATGGAAAAGSSARIESRAVGFAVFDRLLVSVHAPGCQVAASLIERLAADVRLGIDAQAARARLPQSPTDVALQMINAMVDSYLDLRKQLAHTLEQAQAALFQARPRRGVWPVLMRARQRLHLLQELCEEQQDAMQEWLEALRELPLSSYGADPQQAQLQRDQLVARTRDVMQHIDRVLHHARRLEQSAETAVQIHFNAQGQRTNDIMRTLTAITAVFLPLNLFTGFFGMNFDHLPLIHSRAGMWAALVLLVLLALAIVLLFWRRRYLTHARDEEPTS
ncbi:MAG TPA: magnesium transporter CorA family protein [Ottowia sp.]|uniref:magnesium transporter CorA family protein n=1 Tax=Ottowia sp. TaxID=1898956 RepID=UPI002CA3593D|nr:magnesium transporter CorA family protein [Ottowia sp.]HMN19980.1 magnesium transporter CorA family protein [Ottowia sp.]